MKQLYTLVLLLYNRFFQILAGQIDPVQALYVCHFGPVQSHFLRSHCVKLAQCDDDNTLFDIFAHWVILTQIYYI